MKSRRALFRTFVPLSLLCVGCSGEKPAVASKSTAGETAAPIASLDTTISPSTRASGVEHYPAETLRALAESLARSGDPTRTFGRHPSFWYVEAQRTTTGSVEVHDDWIDATFIQAGSGTLLSGGSVTGSRSGPGGEHRGGRIAGGSRRRLGGGDFLIIPAGVPHQYEIPSGDSLRYLTVKIAK